jgi:hypothetical protein
MKNIIIETFKADREGCNKQIFGFHSFLCCHDAKSFLKLVMTELVSEASQARFAELLIENADYTHDTPANISLVELIEEVASKIRRDTHSERNAGAHDEATKQSRKDNYNGKFATYNQHFAKSFLQTSI